MGRSFTIGRIAGIPIKLHWTFGLLILFLIYAGFTNRISITQSIFLMLSVGSLFLCVVLHELGHALMARYYQINTRDIILSPIGGVARLDHLPGKSWHELNIALAGPVVNIILGLFLFLVFLIIFHESPLAYLLSFDSVNGWKAFLRFLLQINFSLFLFNLIPAFPMDGGRILRAIMSLRYGKIYSTKIAAFIGKFLAAIFVIVGFTYHHPILSVIGVVIYAMARKEFQIIQIEERLNNTQLVEIMRSKFAKVNLTDSMARVFDLYNSTQERSFLVFDQLENAVGILHQYFIEEAIKKGAGQSPVSLHSSPKLYFLQAQENVEKAKNLMQKEGLSIIGIKNGDQLTGVIDRQDILKFINK